MSAFSTKIKNRPQNGAEDKKTKAILLDGVFTLREGDVVKVSANGINPTHLLMGLASALSGEGDFLDMKATKKVRGLYLNGTMAFSDVETLAKRYAQSTPELDFLTAEDFTEDDGAGAFDIINPVFQTQLLDHLKEENSYDAVFFDQVPAIPVDMKKEEALLLVRRLIVEIRKMGILQVWGLAENKVTPPFPSELASAVWTVTPKREQGMEIQMTNGASFSTKISIHNVALVESENDGLRVVRRDRADVITVLSLVEKGMNQTAIGQSLGYDQSTVSRMFKGLGLEDDGLIRKQGTQYVLTSVGQATLAGVNG